MPHPTARRCAAMRHPILLSALTALGLATAPAALAQQTLYVANVNDSTIEKFNSGGVGTQFNPTFASGSLNEPTNLTFDSAGKLYVANYGSSTIERFDTATGVGTQFNTAFASGGLDFPYGLAFDSAGNLYVANVDGSKGSTIEKFNSAGIGTQFTPTFASGSLSGTYGLAFDSQGNLYAANFDGNTIEKFNMTTGVGTRFNMAFLSGSLNEPTDLTFDSVGNLYVSNYGNNTIERFNSAGVGTLFAHDGGTIGLAIDSANNLYDGGSTIEKFNTATGVGTQFSTTFVSGGLNNPYGLAFTPAANIAGAPEPSEWAALGFTGLSIGSLLWRAKRRKVALQG